MVTAESHEFVQNQSFAFRPDLRHLGRQEWLHLFQTVGSIPSRDCVGTQAKRSAQDQAGNGETPCTAERGHH